MIKIAIIDSGIDCISECIQQICIKKGNIFHDMGDYLGHGTAMYSIINHIINNKVKYRVLSVKIGDFFEENSNIEIEDLVSAILYSVKWGANVINISLGIKISQKDKNKIDKINEVCKYAYINNALIVTAIDPNYKVAFPWCAANVLRVSYIESKSNKIEIVENKICGYEIQVIQPYIKGNKQIDKFCYYRSNSAASAYITGKIACYNLEKITDRVERFIQEHTNKIKNCIIVDKFFKGIEIYSYGLNEIKLDTKDFGSCIVLPFSKEIESILKYSKLDIKAVLDPVINGNNGKDPYEILNIGKSSIKIFSDLEEINADTVIIGYLDIIENYDIYYRLENIIKEIFNKNMNIYSFKPIKQSIINEFNEKGLFCRCAPIIDKNILEKLRRISNYESSCKTPILGIFGTSSKQGKLTLQMALADEIRRRNIKIITIGTEHQANIIGFDYCYPFGYGAKENLDINIEEKMEFLSRVLDYITYNDSPDIIMVGGQSRLLPYNYETDSGIENAAFLEAIKPDCAILVINPYIDNKEYVKDTIFYLERIYKCKVISLAYSDKTFKLIGNSIFNKKLLEKEVLDVNRMGNNEYNKKIGCIKDRKYIKEIVDLIIDFFTEKD